MRQPLCLALYALAAGCGSVADPAPGSFAYVVRAVAAASALLDGASRALEENGAIQTLTILGREVALAADSSDSLLGRTLVLDTEAARYEPDDARTGAPADGARFVLYALDTSTGVVKRPLVETGYVDVAGAPGGVGVTARAVLGGTTAFQYTASGSTTAYTSTMGVLTGPRWTSATGTVTAAVPGLAFSYSDTVGVCCVPFHARDISHARDLQAGVPGLGGLRMTSLVGTDMMSFDSDNAAEIRAVTPGDAAGLRDSVVVTVRLSGIRGSIGITMIGVNGDTTLLVRTRCETTPSMFEPCFKYQGERVESDTLDHFATAVERAAWLVVTPAYHGIGPAEALLAPLIFSLRQAARNRAGQIKAPHK